MSNDSKNLVIPYGALRANLTLPATTPEAPTVYTIDFGAFEDGNIIIGGDIKKNFAPLGGIIGMDAKARVRAELSYEFQAKYLSPAVMAYIFGASGGAPTPGKVVDLFCIMQMSAQDEVAKSDGSAIYAHHSFKAGIHYEGPMAMNGTDYAQTKMVVDVYLGSFPGLLSLAAARPLA